MNDQYSIKSIERPPQPTRDIISATVLLRTIVLPPCKDINPQNKTKSKPIM